MQTVRLCHGLACGGPDDYAQQARSPLSVCSLGGVEVGLQRHHRQPVCAQSLHAAGAKGDIDGSCSV